MEKIAVPFEDGSIYPYFGRSQQFKVYTVDQGQITDTRIYDSIGKGHPAKVADLKAMEVTVLICANIGAPAIAGVEGAGIDVWMGIDGDADEAVASYLRGTLPHIVATRPRETDMGMGFSAN